ncbi:DUF5057 domain-containing protein [Anaerocolumna sp. MB42-C2]|uniref:DUF5057 domain-containing protein n=1 Tax=Anaerocolumna sp. MB42-C2 TaxID=3070997 RepID=UPI0027DFACCF|nr:DUF5057 domain-containing protein [Anaerocolumna sp. MB42-C2]WMJ88586.1 DUF5057 domain-containing protein [Anaerocolumna sp. MB42-C2]
MKKYILGSILFVISAIIMLKGISSYTQKEEVTKASAAIYGTDGIIPVPKEEGVQGTANNPFVILEVVPYEGYAEIGYLIGGCEPVKLEELAQDAQAAGIVASTKTLNYSYGYEYKFDLETGDTLGRGPKDWEYVNYQTMAQYGYYEKVENGKGNFVQNITSQTVLEAPAGNGGYNKTNLYSKDNYYTLYDTKVKFIPVTEQTPPDVIRYSAEVIDQYSSKKFYTYDNKTGLYTFNDSGRGSVNVSFHRDEVNGRYIAEVIPSSGYISWDDIMITYKKSDVYIPTVDQNGRPNGKYNVTITKADYTDVGAGNGNFVWVPNEDSKNLSTNHNAIKIGDKVHTYRNRYYYRRMKYTLTNKNYFLTECLGIPENKINNYYTDGEGKSHPYNIQVITVTPQELNRVENQSIIDRADLIYFTSRDHFNGDLVAVWEKYHIEKKLNNPPKELADMDLTWETTVKIVKKAAVSKDSAPLIFDVTVYTEISSAYKMNDSPDKYYSDGKPVDKNMLKANGYCSNIAKLFLMTEQMEPGKFYNEYIKTGRIISVPTKNAKNKEVDKYGTRMTTGYYTEQTNEKSAIYWSNQTFLPYELFKNYFDLDNNKVWETIGIDNYRIIVDGGASNVSVRHNAYTYNGDNSITQLFMNSGISENIYRKEAFDFFEELKGTRPNSISPAEAVYYLLHQHKIRYDKDVLRILEIEPCNDFIWDGDFSTWETGKENGNGSPYARNYFTKLFPNFHGKVMIQTITSSEFIGSKTDLNANYDMIFFGLSDGLFNKGNTSINGTWMNNIPLYNDILLNGKVYLHNGDKILGIKKLRGTLGGDYDYTDIYTFSGNDITKLKLDELKNFMEGGKPIILDTGFYTDSGKRVNSVKIDAESYIYDLANGPQDELFYADGISTDKLEDLLSQPETTLKLGWNNNSSPIEGIDYPVVYKDKTISENTALSDDKIYINGLDRNNRTLQYRLNIKTGSDTDYTVKLYTDINGDGRFDEKSECAENVTILSESGNAVTLNQLKGNTNYTLTYKLEPDFSGVLPWKLLIFSNNNSSIRDSAINYCAVKANVKKDLNILQIKSNDDNTIDLSGNSKFLAYTENLTDYNLHIITWTVEELILKCQGGEYQYILEDNEDNNSINRDLNKAVPYLDDDGDGFYEVDMLILGFAHRYTDINSRNALQNIKDFIKTGKSVIFTHDTTSYINTSLTRYKQYGGTESSYWGYKINQTFRNMLGMDRFGVTGALGKENEILGQGFTNLLLSSNAEANPIGDIINRYGFNIYANPNNSLNLDTKYVTNVNKGRITSYPYVIDQNFQVGTTHSQYYQLDMENKDLIVWYCLSDEKSKLINSTSGTDAGLYSSTPNDVRNNYYLYSKGNLTYSGLGNTEQVSDMEMKLFINTIAAAYTAVPKAPQIVINNSNKSTGENGKDYIYIDYDIYDTSRGFGSDIIDGDIQMQKVKFEILDSNSLPNKKLTVKYFEITDQKDGTRTESELTNIKTKLSSSNEETGQIKSGEEYYIELPLTDLAMYNKGKDISIKVFLTYDGNLENTLTSVKEFTLFRRGLFDLD